jgi:hypothetical protein
MWNYKLNAKYFGWRDPDAQFRSIMAYQCATDECDDNPSIHSNSTDGIRPCIRIQRSSNPDILYNEDKVVGAAGANNAEYINGQVSELAAFRNATCFANEDCGDSNELCDDSGTCTTAI